MVVGDECYVGEQAVLSAGVKIYPHKTVEAGAIVNSSLVGEPGHPQSVRPGRCGRVGQRRRHPRTGYPGGHGLCHHPQEGHHRHYLARLEQLRPHAQRAVMAGLNAGGINVDDLEVASVPVTHRWAEGTTDTHAASRAQEYVERILAILP